MIAAGLPVKKRGNFPSRGVEQTGAQFDQIECTPSVGNGVGQRKNAVGPTEKSDPRPHPMLGNIMTTFNIIIIIIKNQWGRPRINWGFQFGACVCMYMSSCSVVACNCACVLVAVACVAAMAVTVKYACCLKCLSNPLQILHMPLPHHALPRHLNLAAFVCHSPNNLNVQIPETIHNAGLSFQFVNGCSGRCVCGRRRNVCCRHRLVCRPSSMSLLCVVVVVVCCACVLVVCLLLFVHVWAVGVHHRRLCHHRSLFHYHHYVMFNICCVVRLALLCLHWAMDRVHLLCVCVLKRCHASSQSLSSSFLHTSPLSNDKIKFPQ